MTKLRTSVLLCALLLTVPPAHAQESDSSSCKPTGSLELGSPPASDTASARPQSPATRAKQVRVTDRTPAVSVTPATQAESFVQNRIEEDGIHVVHFWAPWCSNSTHELDTSWPELVRQNPNVTFTFVTIWNDNQRGASVLDAHNLPDRVAEVTLPDLGPSDIESNRRRSFLSLPVTWIPSTWIFHKQGELAFALNYGEMDTTTLQSLLNVTRSDW